MAANSKIHNQHKAQSKKKKKRYTKYTAHITVKEKDSNCTCTYKE